MDFAINPPAAPDAGSDYAQLGVDYAGPTAGTVTFAAGQTNATITIGHPNAGSSSNKILRWCYRILVGVLGAVSQATVTILAMTAGALASVLPAGSVDPYWNKDNTNDSTPPYLKYPGTQGGVSGTANGNGGTVMPSWSNPMAMRSLPAILTLLIPTLTIALCGC